MPRKTFTFDGKRYDISAKTKSELAAKVALKRRDLEEGKRSISKHMTVREWSKKWLEVYKENSVSAKTLEMYQTAANAILDEMGGVMLKDVKPIRCQSLLNKKTGGSKSAVSKIRMTMKQMFAVAAKNGLMIENPAADLAMPKTTSGTHRPLTDMERKLFLKVCKTNPYGLWALTMYYCGLRPGETGRIHGRHIDLKTRTLHVEGTKTASSVRDVPIPEKLAERLTRRKFEPFTPIFTNENGQPITTTNRKRMWKSIIKDMHIAGDGDTDYGELKRVIAPYVVAKDFVPYCLRHDYATRLQDAGVPLNVAKDLLGHKSIEMTARIYTHTSKKSFDDARKKIDSLKS